MRVRTKSGLMGERSRLHRRYDSLDEFRHYSSMYGLHRKLGYKSAEAAWKADPMVESSVIPSDFRRVRKGRNPRRRSARGYSKRGRLRNPRKWALGAGTKLPEVFGRSGLSTTERARMDRAERDFMRREGYMSDEHRLAYRGMARRGLARSKWVNPRRRKSRRGMVMTTYHCPKCKRPEPVVAVSGVPVCEAHGVKMRPVGPHKKGSRG